ncbi:EndoU domain-containing protein [Allokutzneria oryzae]|uniref:EndoU domain-containing protein n=1 Tax=Allokutzneria oryzae TaxID=1378989 RepID=A0ABV5ZQM6_9PSEU
MTSCRALAARLRGIATSLPIEHLVRAASHAEAAAAQLRHTQGRHATALAASATDLEAAAGIATTAAAQLRQAAEWMDRYCTDILGVAAPGRPPDIGREPPDPLPAFLDEHLFRGHSRYTSVTGYHHRRGGLDRGRMRISERDPADSRGVYWAVVTGPTTTGRSARKRSGSTFFPDTWSEDEVRHAVRAAFTARRRILDDDGDVVPGKWEGEHRGIVIQGYLVRGTDFDAATLDDIGSLYPLPLTLPRRAGDTSP